MHTPPFDKGNIELLFNQVAICVDDIYGQVWQTPMSKDAARLPT